MYDVLTQSVADSPNKTIELGFFSRQLGSRPRPVGINFILEMGSSKRDRKEKGRGLSTVFFLLYSAALGINRKHL